MSINLILDCGHLRWHHYGGGGPNGGYCGPCYGNKERAYALCDLADLERFPEDQRVLWFVSSIQRLATFYVVPLKDIIEETQRRIPHE